MNIYEIEVLFETSKLLQSIDLGAKAAFKAKAIFLQVCYVSLGPCFLTYGDISKRGQNYMNDFGVSFYKK